MKKHFTKQFVFLLSLTALLVLGVVSASAKVYTVPFTEKSGYSIKDERFCGVYPGETAGDIKNSVEDGRAVKITNAYGSSVKDSDKAATSMKVQIEFEQNEYSIVIKGDMSGDGNVNSTDYLKLKKYFAGTDIKGLFFEAADINNDTKLSSVDYLRIKGYFAGKVDLFPSKENIPEKTPVKYEGPYSEFNGAYGGVDAIGREQYYDTQVTTGSKEKEVGIFYFLWLGAHDATGPFNNEKIVASNPNATLSLENWQAAGGGPLGASHHWGEPLFGYYRASDEWVLRKHVQMLTMAGIDYLVFDTTNAFTYDSNALILFKVLDEYSKQGWDVPKFAYMTHSLSPQTMDHIYKEIYLAHPEYSHLWYMHDGKPLIIGVDPSDEIREFFTFRRCVWPNEPLGTIDDPLFPFIDEARWLTPESVYGKDGRKELIDVSLSQRVTDVASRTAWYGGHDRTRGYRGQWYKNTSDADALLMGTNYEIGFDFALKQDVESIFLTGWNEWAAQLSSWDSLPVVFVDNADTANSRDIEPMNGILKDNYYMQTINYVKEFKSADSRVDTGANKTIDINGSFTQWNNVPAQYTDFTNDIVDRNAWGWNNLIYTDNSGRNDFKLMKVAKDAANIYFYVQTENDIKGQGDGEWMNLYIRSGKKAVASWEGFDFAVNRKTPANGKMSIEKYGTSGWETVGEVSYKLSGKELMIAVPKAMLGIGNSELVDIQFKWADNCDATDDIMNFYTKGDTAPYGRLTYIYSEIVK